MASVQACKQIEGFKNSKVNLFQKWILSRMEVSERGNLVDKVRYLKYQAQYFRNCG